MHNSHYSQNTTHKTILINMRFMLSLTVSTQPAIQINGVKFDVVKMQGLMEL